jgi:integrase
MRWEEIDWEMSRMSIPEPKVEHHEGRGIRSCPIFPELRPILDEAFEIFGDKSEFVVAAPQYRAAANTAMGWKNSNLRTEMTRLLRRAGVSGWSRLFHSMRASRQTELQREFPLHVVCSWLGNSPRIAQQSYLLVTEDDFAKATGVKKGDGGGACQWLTKPRNRPSSWVCASKVSLAITTCHVANTERKACPRVCLSF